MAISVADLLEMPHLRLRLVSGEGGTGRPVSWTHVSDLPEPWRWLTGGELLLTNGMSFPADGPGQRDLLERLDEAGASGLAIGEEMYCPPLTEELLEASGRLRLSVLAVGYPMPFVAIAKAVAAANLLEQSDRLVRTEKIYRTVQRMVPDRGDESMLSGPLSQLLGCEVHVCHRASGEPWYPGDPRLDPVVSEALWAIAGRDADLRAGALLIPLDDGRDLRLMDVPTLEGALMVLVSERRIVVDAILMQHAVTVLALELSQSLVGIEHHRRLGSEVLGQLLDGRVDPRSARRQLKPFGVRMADARLVAVVSDDAGDVRQSHIALWRNAIRHLGVYRSGVLYVLTDAVDATREVLRADLGPAALIASSGLLRDVERVPEAVREATWAVGAAKTSVTRTFSYGDATPLIGLGSIDDAAALASRVLGPILEHERRHDTPLLETLDAYLSHGRSWQRTADALSIHRQTVLYRIRKIEEITGRSLDDTGYIVELWLALQAQALLSPAERGAQGARKTR